MIGYEYLLGVISPRFNASPISATHAIAINPALNLEASASWTPAPLIAGAAARAFATTAISPIEMFRTRLQALPTAAGSPTYASTTKDMVAMVQTKGLTMLWRGLGPTLWRDVPFSGESSLDPLTTRSLLGRVRSVENHIHVVVVPAPGPLATRHVLSLWRHLWHALCPVHSAIRRP
jgi:hypothetical protein